MTEQKKEGEAWGVKNPDSHKEAGNKLFSEGKFVEAIKEYTLAIEMSAEKPNHIYHANRGNCFLEMGMLGDCILDCRKSIELDPTFAKAYYRKARAFYMLDNLLEA